MGKLSDVVSCGVPPMEPLWCPDSFHNVFCQAKHGLQKAQIQLGFRWAPEVVAQETHLTIPKGEWGCGKMMLKARGVHRGGATRHASEHALCAIFLAHRPGLRSLGHAMHAFLAEHADSAAPTKCWTRHGWHACIVGNAGDVTMPVPETPVPETIVLKRPAASATGAGRVSKRPAAKQAPPGDLSQPEEIPLATPPKQSAQRRKRSKAVSKDA